MTPEDPNAPPLTPDVPPAAARRRVLVIDDHADAAETLEVLLSLVGLEVRAVRSAFAAFDVLTEFRPDVCLVDLRMPGMDGFEAARRLLVLLGPRVKLIAVTGELAAAADPRSAVFQRVLTKPVDMPELLRELGVPPPGS